MRRSIVGLAVLGLMGCASGGVFGGRQPDVVVVGDDGRGYPDDDRRYPDDRDYPDRGRSGGRGNNGRGNKNGHYKNGKAGYRTLSVASAYYPQPGLCRLWFTGRLGRVQPRATSCDRLYGRVPAGSFILYGGNAWDGDYDWYAYDRQYRGRVPRMIVQISMSMRRYR